MKLSIITINLNNAAGLQKTIKSIISQKYNDYELLVIDGGSTEDDITIINRHEKKIKYWLSEKDNGIYHAMNKGIKHAQGDYCFFLNSGDYFVDEMVLTKVFNIEFTEDVVFGNLQVFMADKMVAKCNGKDKLSFLDIYGNLIKHQSSFIKRQLFDKFGLYNEHFRIVADWEFFIKSVGLGGASYRYLDIDISCFDNNGISNNNGSLTAYERMTVIKTYLPVMMQPDYEFLLKFGRYELVTRNWVTLLLVRILYKGIRIFNKIFPGK